MKATRLILAAAATAATLTAALFAAPATAAPAPDGAAASLAACATTSAGDTTATVVVTDAVRTVHWAATYIDYSGAFATQSVVRGHFSNTARRALSFTYGTDEGLSVNVSYGSGGKRQLLHVRADSYAGCGVSG